MSTVKTSQVFAPKPMSTINSLVNGILEQLSTNKNTAPQELLTSVHSLLDVLPIANTLRPIQTYKLLQGLLFAQPDLQFLQRLSKEPEQKQALAKYCLDKCELHLQIRRFLDNDQPTLRRVFFESGSTIAHCIGMFADRLSDAQRRRTRPGEHQDSPSVLNTTVVTNNLTGVTALAGLVKELEPIQGRLSVKYFGFFPFAESEAESSWRAEGKRFNLLAEDIESCEAVFATCSNFSFITGPIVGGRDNCLTKRAMYAGAERWSESDSRSFYVLFHFEKMVPVISAYGMQFENPQPTCNSVFAPPSRTIGDALHEWRYSHDEDHAVSSAKFDGTWHDDMRELSVRGRPSNSQGIRIPVEKFEAAINAQRVRVPHKLSTGWADWLQHSVGLNILISLPRNVAEKALACIKEEISRANNILERAHYGIKFNIKNESSAVSDLVAHVVKN